MDKLGDTQEFQQANLLKEELLKSIEKVMETDGISQGEIARRIGAQRYNVNKVMRRKFAVSLDLLVKIAESIGLEVGLKVRRTKE